MRKFEILDHPSDLLVRGMGTTFCELLMAFIDAMIDQCVAERGECRSEKLEFVVDEDDGSELLITTLNEMLFHLFFKSFIPDNCSISKKAEKVFFEFTGKNCQEIKFSLEIKSATYHNIRFEKKEDHFEATILFDI